MRIKIALWMGCVAVGCLALSLRAGEDAPKPAEKPKKVWQQLRPERVISDKAMLYLATPDLAQARAAFQRTALHGLLAEEQIGQPVLNAIAKLREAYVKGDGTRSEPEQRRRNDEANLLLQLAPLLDGQVALEIDADFPAGARMPRFLLVASMSSEDRQREIEAALEKYRYGQTAADSHFLDFNDRAGNYDVCRIENSELGVNESWAFVENLFIYGQGKGVVEEAVQRYSSGNNAGALALNSGYQSAYREVGRDDHGGDALLYVQADAVALTRLVVARAYGVALPPLPFDTADLRPSIALGIQAGDGDNAPIKEKLLVRLPKEALAKTGENCKAVSARFAQNDTLFFNACQYKASDLFAAAAPALKRYPALGIMAQQLRTVLGAPADADLQGKLEMFKGEFAWFVSYVPQPSSKLDSALDFLQSFQMVIAAELNPDLNDVEFHDVMEKLEGATHQSYTATTINNVTIRYQKGAAPHEERDAKSASGPLGLKDNLLPLLQGHAQDGATLPFFLSYARVDLDAEAGAPPRKFLLLSDNFDALRKTVTQLRAPRASLAEDARFKDMLHSFRPARFDVGFADVNKAVDLYAALLPNLAFQNPGSHDLFDKLPTAETLRAHASPMGWCVSRVNDPEGLVVQTLSPTGNLPLVGIGSLLAWPVMVERQALAVSQEVDGRFKQIMLGMQLYAADFDRYPQQLSELYSSYVKDLKVFESPFKRGALKTGQDIDNPDLSNLVYVPNHSLRDLGNDVLVYEKEPTRVVKTDTGVQVYYHVITLDGKKTWLIRQALELRLAGKFDYVSKLTDSGEGSVPAAKKSKK